MNKLILDNYRTKTEQELKDTFEGMSEAALSGMWKNFDVEEWLECAEVMLKVIRERDGFEQRGEK
jgi:hypothetical protein